MDFKMPAGTKPFSLGALAGAILIAWVGFDALGWKTASTSETIAKRQADTAVTAALASICTEQFKRSAQFSAHMTDLAKAERYSRGDIVAKGGWATMVGSKEPQPGVAQLCADLLLPAKS
jgi:hypothetical protein